MTIQEFARRHPFLYPSKRYDAVEPAADTTAPGAATVFEAIFILNVHTSCAPHAHAVHAHAARANDVVLPMMKCVVQHPEDWGEALQICVDLVLTNGNILDTSRRAAPNTVQPPHTHNRTRTRTRTHT